MNGTEGNGVPVVPVLTTETLKETTPPPVPMVPGLLRDEADGDEHEERRDMERQQVYQARPFTWQGRQLAPFAIDREGDWLVHRATVGAPKLMVVLGQSSAFLPDAVRILWFCSHEPEVWLGGVSGLALEVQIRQWGVENIPPGRQIEAVNLALDIHNRAHELTTRVKPDPKTDKHAGNLPGPSSEPNT